MMQLPLVFPPFSKNGKLLESSCRKALLQFDLIDKNTSSIAVALSGGKDSLTLLYLLHAINGYGFEKFDLHAIYVKGEVSCGANINEAFLKAICKKLNVNFIVKTSCMKLDTLECYSCSRERRKLIFDAAKEVGVSTIAFGHHRDDIIQTLLMNLLHKGEFATMLPKLFMYEYDVTIIRPLIFIAEKDILSFAAHGGFLRQSCQCPHGQNSMRKKVDKLIDEMETFFPHVRKNLAHAAFIYGSDKAAKKPKSFAE